MSVFKASLSQNHAEVPQLMLAVAICETCPPDEANFIIPIMLNLFDSRASLLALLKMLVDREVSRAGEFSYHCRSRGCTENRQMILALCFVVTRPLLDFLEHSRRSTDTII